jgi:hypothetical protein
LVVFRTLTTPATQAGQLRPVGDHSFPDATTVEMPTERRFATASVMEESSLQSGPWLMLSPALMLAAAVARVCR